MNLELIAKAYTECITLEEQVRQESSAWVDDVAVLRADLHALLMEALRLAGISFSDRSEAARIAFDIVKGKHKTSLEV